MGFGLGTEIEVETEVEMDTETDADTETETEIQKRTTRLTHSSPPSLPVLHTYGLQDHFKLNIEPNHTTLAGHDYEHDLLVASKFGMSVLFGGVRGGGRGAQGGRGRKRRAKDYL